MAMYHVLLPIDTDTKRVRAQAEAVIALPAASESVEVTLLHVFEDEVEEPSVKQLTAGDRVIEFLTEERPVASLDTEIRSGDVAAEILDAAETHEVDALVLGGRKRSPMGSLLFGSITTDVLLHADRPVTVTGDHLVEERKDSPLMGEEQDDVYTSPRKDLSEDSTKNPPDFADEEENS